MSKILARYRATILTFTIIAVFAGGFLVAKLWAQKVTNLHQSLQRFSYILNLIMVDYVEEVDGEKLIKSAVDGMMQALDPYSEVMELERYNDLKSRLDAEFGGIGIYIGTRDNYPSVISPIEGTPAYKVGLIAGDKIVKIEDKPTENMTIQEAMKLLRGVPGTEVNITCHREGVSELLDFKIIRDTIRIKAVPYAGTVANQIGYIRLADFSKVAGTELETAIDSLFHNAGVTKLIFDLRSNPGGYLQEGYEVSDLFLAKGKEIVTARGRRADATRKFVATDNEKHGDFPLVLLVDRGSASASEIVAGALQDWERAFIIGDTTFGKGSVQNIMTIDENTAIKITNAYWYTPSGRCINRPQEIKAVLRDTTKKEKEVKYFTLGPQKREIYSGGGIVPDYHMAYRRLNELESRIVSQGLFFDFAVKYTAIHKDLAPEFVVTEQILNEFKTLVTAKKIEFTQAKFDSSQEYIKQEIEREIKAKLFGTKGDYEVRLRNDEQVQKAIEFLQKANTTADLFREIKK
ncbi:MAG: S41 family peptidase [Candidatus Latescibacteria bacterium]|nr:S41 family peptidase [Candidatus Latescibacterota bacterium]